jgi:amino acid transporter
MSNRGDRNYVSVGFWILAFIVMAIPFVNIIMAFVWAFAGDNQSRQNYFRAFLILTLVFFILAIGFGMLAPHVLEHLKNLKPAA